jgi:SAM-dependent methyltransferase
MFFPERITKIEAAHRVLEIGPGADPHPRSDVFLELAYEDEKDLVKQFGHNRKLDSAKQVVFYDGKKFPFNDNEFDYVICSHVVEHVHDVEFFMSEIFRVGKRGYMEYPLAYYDYLFNFDVHTNFVKFDNGELKYMKKNETPLDAFKPLQEFLLQAFNKGYTAVVKDLLPYFMEGFQWEKPFPVRHVLDIAQICHSNPDVPVFKERELYTFGPKRLLRELIRSIKLKGKY